MRKSLMFLFTMIMAFSIKSFSQQSESLSRVPPTFLKADSTVKVRKNLIGINTVPALVVLMGGISGYENKFSMMFKRLNENRTALRIGASYTRILDSDRFMFRQLYEIIKETDSTQLREYNFAPYGQRLQLNIGYEFIRGKKKLKRFYGADFVIGYYHSFSGKYRESWFKDTTSVYNINGWTPLYHEAPILTERTIDNIFFIGLSPFYGLRYPISNRFLMSVQVGFNGCIGLEKIKTSGEYINTFTHSSTIPYFFLSGIIDDVSLIFRF